MTERRYDLDWLRVLVFAVLIFYHVGMLYVADWGFHYKSANQSEWLQSLMILVNQWRLPLLFLISGIAMRFLLHKVSLWRFLGLRTIRLWVPLLLGVWVIVPPQLYVEMISKGDLPNISYLEFYWAFFDLSHPYFESYQSGIWPHVDVNHLWFIRELWYFSMYLLIAYFVLQQLRLFERLEMGIKHLRSWGLLIWPVLLLTLCQFWLFPENSEGHRKALGFSFLCLGFLIGWHPGFWAEVKALRWRHLKFAVLGFLILITYYHLAFKGRGDEPDQVTRFLEILIVQTNRWAWLLMILGFAQTLLNHNHRYLPYLNEAVYPFYILHQTILIVTAYGISGLALNPVLEAFVVIVATFGGCFLGYEIIRRFGVLRFLFGLKVGVAKGGFRLKGLARPKFRS